MHLEGVFKKYYITVDSVKHFDAENVYKFET